MCKYTKCLTSRLLFNTLIFSFFMACMTAQTDVAAEVKLNLNTSQNTHIIFYADAALVSQTFKSHFSQGHHRIILQSCPLSSWQPDSLFFYTRYKEQHNHAAFQNSYLLPSTVSWNTTNSGNALKPGSLHDQPITVIFSGHKKPVKGQLVYEDKTQGIIKDKNGKMSIIKWQPDMIVQSRFLPGLIKNLDDQKTVRAAVDLPQDTSRLTLSYINKKISMNNTYRLFWDNTHSTMSLFLDSQIINRSEQNYDNASVVLASQQLSPDMSRNLMIRSTFAEASMAKARTQRKGDTQLISLEKTYSIKAHSHNLLNVFSFDHIPATTNYVYRFDGRYGQNSITTEHPAGELLFKAPDDLPSGSIQLFSDSAKGVELENSSQMTHTAKSSPVMVDLGTAYTIDMVKSRKDDKKEQGQRVVQWNFSMINHKNKPVSLALQDLNALFIGLKGEDKSKRHQLTVQLQPLEKKELTVYLTYPEEK